MGNLIEQFACILHRSGEGDEAEDQVFPQVRAGKRDAMPDGEGVDLPQFGDGGGAGMQESNAFLENVRFLGLCCGGKGSVR